MASQSHTTSYLTTIVAQYHTCYKKFPVPPLMFSIHVSEVWLEESNYFAYPLHLAAIDTICHSRHIRYGAGGSSNKLRILIDMFSLAVCSQALSSAST